ncbi:MAG: hypothetical protein IKR74_03365 [Bacilli bacterium]|nr:hypothetical protein [Bacilli bacterium]
MSKKECSFIAIGCIVITIVLIGLMSISIFYNKNDNDILSDGATLAIYVDNNEVASLNDVPSGYVIDTTQSYCYKTDRNTPDTGAILQSSVSGEPIMGNVVKNEKCMLYFKPSLASWLINSAPKSGTDSISNSPWILTSDHTNEWRYAGKNPDNYIQFNGELWRIIGVMPNTTYCTGVHGAATECNTTATGSLVKIIRNASLGNYILDYKQTGVGTSTSAYGSNDWSDSQLMYMLNGYYYYKTAYDTTAAKLHSSYAYGLQGQLFDANGIRIFDPSSNYITATNGTTIVIPSSVTTANDYSTTTGTVPKKIESSALNKIATVKWNLRGTNSYTTPSDFYSLESSTGAVYTNASLPENRAVYWYGKIGLMYPSDYGYATSGGTTYNRASCLGSQMSGWNAGDYKTDCALKSWMLFQNITSTAPGTAGANYYTITPLSNNAYRVFRVSSDGALTYRNVYSSLGVRPTLYLKAGTAIIGGSGKWNDPYTIA